MSPWKSARRPSSTSTHPMAALSTWMPLSGAPTGTVRRSSSWGSKGTRPRSSADPLRRIPDRRYPGGSLVPALLHPLLDLGGEEVEGEGAGRLVRSHVLTVDLAALHEELPAAADDRAPAERDGNRLGHHLALERLGWGTAHGTVSFERTAVSGSFERPLVRTAGCDYPLLSSTKRCPV